MGSIKPYKETKCSECVKTGDSSVKMTIAKLCFKEPNFHYQKRQQGRAKKRELLKISKPKKKLEKSIPKLIKEAQDAVNAFIRKRDSKDGYFTCISCNEVKPTSQLNAGHFYSAGNHSYLRFNESNIHSQCIRCNCHLHGNLLPYRTNLIKKIGQSEVDKLEAYSKLSQKWNRIQLMAIIQLYKNKLKELNNQTI